MLPLSKAASLRDLQDYISGVERERGFLDQTTLQKCLLLGEEVGELFKAVRKSSGLGVDPNSHTHSVGEELADVLSFLLAIANRLEIDLATAFMEKERKNEGRVWLEQGRSGSS